MREPALRAATAGLALVGAGIAGYLVYARYSHGAIACTTGGCETVQSSSYAEVLGIPVAVLGLAGYLAILGAAARPGELARAACLSLALGGFGFSLYLLYVQLAVLDAVCQWCVASDGVMAVIVVAALLRLRSSPVGAAA